MEDRPRDRLKFYRNWIGFFLLGTINNLPYVVINSSAKVLATSFDKDNLVTLVMFANVAFGFLSKGSNTLLTLTRFPFWIRFVINGCFMLIGLLGVAFAPNFWIALVAIVFAGTSSSFGENLTLGYLQMFPKEFINAWSSGTGMAGLLGALLYIGLSCIAETVILNGGNSFTYFNPRSPSYITEIKSINKFVFLGTIPLVFVYWMSYFIVISKSTIQKASDDDSKGLIENKSFTIQQNNNDKEEVTEGTFQRLLRCFKITLWLAINMSLVYLFEYTVRGFAAKSRPQYEYYVSEVHCPELYSSLQLCYQWKYLPVYLLPALMVYVGLIGGASYVNIFYLLRTDQKFPDKDKELCINIMGVWMTLGVLLGTSLPIPLYSTILKDK